MTDALSTNDFAALLSEADTPEQPAKDSGADKEQQAEDDADPAADTEGGTTDEAEQTEEDAADDKDGQPPAGPADDAVVKWETAQGEEFAVPVAELKNGYMRDADYRQKTQALADERKAVVTQVQQQYQELEAYSEELGQVTSLQAQIKQYQALDWQAIRAADPQQHSALFADYMLLKDKASDAAQALNAKREKLTQGQQQAFRQASQEAAEALKRAIPNFGAETLKAMREYGVKEGFTAEELAQVADKRLLLMLHKAAQWDALQGKKPEVHNKVRALPPKGKPAPSGAARPSKQEQVVKAINSRRNFSTDDFATLLAATRK